MLDNIQIDHIMKLLHEHHLVIRIATEYTEHYIERVMVSAKDRGRYKWHAGVNANYYRNAQSDSLARNCHIDAADLFPRYYFLEESLINEIDAWLEHRSQPVLAIEPYEA